jgi:hypothetical protein
MLIALSNGQGTINQSKRLGPLKTNAKRKLEQFETSQKIFEDHPRDVQEQSDATEAALIERNILMTLLRHIAPLVKLGSIATGR